MANLRPALLIALVFLGYLIWIEWQKEHTPPSQAAGHTTAAVTQGQKPQTGIPANSGDVPADLPAAKPGQKTATSGDVPTPVATATQAEEPEVPLAHTDSDRPAGLIHVQTDVLGVDIDPLGGTVVSAHLLKYPVTPDQPDQTVEMLTRSGNELFVAQSGLLSRQPAPNHTARYQTTQTDYRLRSGENRLEVPMTWTDDQGLSVTKTFVFKRGDYAIDVEHRLSNQTRQAWTGSSYEQLQRTKPPASNGGRFNNPERYSYRGIGFYSPEEKLEKVKFDKVAEEPYERTTKGGWLAMIRHYFFAAWIPPGDETDTYSTQAYNPDDTPRYIARSVAAPVTVAPDAEHQFSDILYVGPKLQDKLEHVAPGLDLTVNYGIFTIFSAPLFWLLSKIHGFVGNWGWAIVLLTVMIKMAFFKLTETQYRSMARMRKLQPRIEKLKERYGDDRQRMSQAMMQMYKEEKVNPLGGCLPILVQIPIFIALYWVLLESVELRQAPFILWIHNLSVRDPYFVLPLLNATFMILTQRLTPTAGMEPLQRKMMAAMPVVFSVMFAFFPAGLVLYWATNAGLSLTQQWYITRKIAAAG